MVKDCHNCEHHTWGDEWWNCKTECNKCRYTDMQGEKVPSNWKQLPMTNADRIRAMSDEELSDFITSQSRGICTDICREMHYQSNLEWLKQPAKGDA